MEEVGSPDVLCQGRGEGGEGFFPLLKITSENKGEQLFEKVSQTGPMEEYERKKGETVA